MHRQGAVGVRVARVRWGEEEEEEEKRLRPSLENEDLRAVMGEGQNRCAPRKAPEMLCKSRRPVYQLAGIKEGEKQQKRKKLEESGSAKRRGVKKWHFWMSRRHISESIAGTYSRARGRCAMCGISEDHRADHGRLPDFATCVLLWRMRGKSICEVVAWLMCGLGEFIRT